VSGAAGRVLGGIARARWMCATGERVQACVSGEAWPQSVAPDFTDIDVGIARTQPRHDGQDEVREAEQLFLDSIDHAERSIYIENQFLTCTKVAERLARRLRDCPDLEVLIVAPQHHNSWLEARTMRQGGVRFLRMLHAAAGGGAAGSDRRRPGYPEGAHGAPVTD